MILYCLTHSHKHGIDAYIFKAKGFIDAGEAASQLNVDFSLQGENVVVASVSNISVNSVECPILAA